MTDIVERLRGMGFHPDTEGPEMMAEAADVIERLRAERKYLSDFTDAEIALEHHNRMMQRLGDPLISVSGGKPA